MSTFFNPIGSIPAGLLRTAYDQQEPNYDTQLAVLIDQGAKRRADFLAEVTERKLQRAVQGQLNPGVQADYLAWVFVPYLQPVEATEPGESIEMKWLVENNQYLEQFRGEWLLIRGLELLAHSPLFADIERAIAAFNIRSPFVYYVPTEQESRFVS